MSADEDIDLDLLNQTRPGIARSLDRSLVWLDELRSRPEVVGFTVVILLGLMAVAYMGSRSGPEVDVANLIPEIRLETTLPASVPEAQIVVHVSGAVMSPGIYMLDPGARVMDAITAAGGPTAEGLVHELNLAAPVADGVQVRVPIEGETVQPVGPDAGSVIGPIDVNSATAAELESLRGIGPALAAALISYREENGPFGSVEALLEVPGIGPAKLDMFSDQVSVG